MSRLAEVESQFVKLSPVVIREDTEGSGFEKEYILTSDDKSAKKLKVTLDGVDVTSWCTEVHLVTFHSKDAGKTGRKASKLKEVI